MLLILEMRLTSCVRPVDSVGRGGTAGTRTGLGFKDDLVMALWFAWDRVRRANMDSDADAGVDFGDYPALDFGIAPWDEMIA